MFPKVAIANSTKQGKSDYKLIVSISVQNMYTTSPAGLNAKPANRAVIVMQVHAPAIRLNNL